MARKYISGLERLNRKLMRLPIEAEKAIRLAMEKGADEVVALAKSVAVTGQASGVNSSNNPGALKDSIGWVWGPAPKGTITLGKVRNTARRDGDLYITIYAGNEEAFYARWVEFGTRPHDINAVNQPTMGRGGANFGTHVDHPGATAKPFFYPSYRSLRRRIKTRVSRAVNASARKVANSS